MEKNLQQYKFNFL